jgi:hypothetical protein
VLKIIKSCQIVNKVVLINLMNNSVMLSNKKGESIMREYLNKRLKSLLIGRYAQSTQSMKYIIS